MRKRRLSAIAAVISAILMLHVTISLGLVGVPGLPPPSSNLAAPLGASSTEVLVHPTMNVTDYEDPNHNVTIGSTVDFNANISDVTDLFTWHIKLSWDKDILNSSLILYGDFLSSGTVSPNGTSSDVADITGIFHDDGYGWAAESVLGEYVGVSGSGALLEIRLDIVGYGHTYINVNVTGSMPTELINSTMGSIGFATEDGYFRNTIPGDIQGDTTDTPPDGDVDMFDFFAFADHYATLEGDPNYNILADLQGDTAGTLPDADVDMFDFFAFADSYTRSVVLP
jgi:hypothetical protein